MTSPGETPEYRETRNRLLQRGVAPRRAALPTIRR